MLACQTSVQGVVAGRAAYRESQAGGNGADGIDGVTLHFLYYDIIK